MEYNERLKKLKMPTLKYRRMRGDMIEVFKIINDIYDPLTTVDMFELNTTSNKRGHSKKRLRSCIVPAEITEPPKISGGQNHKYDTIGTTVDAGLLPLCPPLNPHH
jgi:hypothetical protein